MENKEGFCFTYSAAQQQEVENIRKKYLPKEADKMELLRKLHNSATEKAQAWSLVIGVIGALVLGGGMSLCITKPGALAMAGGILLGIAGMILVALAYPVYNRVLRKERERIAPEILRLSEELLK